MRNKVGIGLWMLSLLALRSPLGYAQHGELSPEHPAQAPVSKFVFVDVNGNLSFHPETNRTCDNGTYFLESN